MGISNSPLCDKCGDIETATHFLCKCPAYIKARAKYLGGYILSIETLWSIHPKRILEFLNSANRV